jgi:endonuclease V
MEVIYEDYELIKTDLPYVPGYLAFREVPALLSLIERIKKNKPELLP